MSEQTKATKYMIVGRYKRLAVNKAQLPLFCAFYPNNIVKFSVNLQPEKVGTFLKTVNPWFEELKLIQVTKE